MKDSMIYLHLLRIIVVATIVVDGGLNSGCVDAMFAVLERE
jgi:hypothetical protein